MTATTTDQLFIKSLTVETSIGCLAWEKTIKQKLLIDLDLDFDCQKAGLSDELADALDYAAVASLVAETATSKHYALVEHLAATLSQNIFASFPVAKIAITVTKPQAIPAVGAVGVRLVRHAPQS